MKRIRWVLVIVCLVALAGCATGNGIGADDGGDDGSDGVGGIGSPTEITAVNVTPPQETDQLDDDGGPSPEINGEFEIHHIDVGQADSTLIITPAGETILIDTGDWRPAGEQVINYLEAEGINRIDHLVATHGHADHIGGHAAIIEWAETEGGGIGAAYDSGVPSDSATYERYLDAVEEYDVELFLVQEGDELPLSDDNLTALVVNPTADPGDDLDRNSVALAFEFGEFRYLTTGDADHIAEERMTDEWAAELDADVYQAGHHGSSTSSTAPLLDAVSPRTAVISSAYDSQYGHPHDEVLEAFADRGIETYWTGVHGDVVVRTDGTEWRVETEHEFSADAAVLLEEKPSDEDSQDAISPGPINAPAAIVGV